ncbi:hypothetical protein ACMGGS_12295 [Superficieibacter sp. BNK-5]|uniref:hypothetical protein n=1 Tax=Superficieibacter sp. BNK-5 TaxID=3376142 RepID=UPI0039BF132B
MARYDTDNPVPSSDMRDIWDDNLIQDEILNGDSLSVVNRKGKSLKTWSGIEAEHLRRMDEQDAAFQSFLESSGYNFLGDYEGGPYTFTARNQYIRFDNQYWKINKETNTGFTTSGNTLLSWGNDKTHFTLIDGDTLRQELISSGGSVMIGTQSGKTVQTEFNQFKEKQDWGRTGADTRTANDARILIQRGDKFDRIYVYLNHKSNQYQQWEFTRGGGSGDGFDNNVPTNPNGNMWFIAGINNVIVGPVKTVAAIDSAMNTSGSTLVSGQDLRINSGYAETTVFGKTVFLDYVARADSGIANIYIDGVLYGTLDQYNSSSGGVLTRAKIAENLSNANHVVKVEVSGNKNANSSASIVRLRSVTGVGLQDFDNVAAFGVFDAPMKSGNTTYKLRQAASELAIETTVNGNKVFSGAYHKYCYPRAPDNQKLYIDGVMVDFDSMVAGEIIVANDLRMQQDLILSNTDTTIADVLMSHHFKNNGCNVKTNLTWTYPALISRSYQAMWPSTADRAILGGMQKQYSALRNGEYINVYQDACNAMAYHTVDDWVSGFYANNEYGMRFENPNYIGLYIWDRSSDFKIYLRKFSGLVNVGEKWNSDVTFFIGHCPETTKVFSIDTAS